MPQTRRRFCSAGAAGAVTLAIPGLRSSRVAVGQSDPALYAIEEIGVLEGDDASFAFAISSRGWVTGMSRNSATGGNQAFIFRDGKLRLRQADGMSGVGWAINRSASIAGNVTTGTTTSGAAMWDGSAMTLLPALGGTGAQAFGLNDDGVVTGGSQLDDDGPFQACAWIDGVVRALPSLGGASFATAINNAGLMVGSASEQADVTAPGSHATLWDGDEMIDLGTIAGPTSMARTINDRGQIAGHTTTTDDGVFGQEGTHACLWEEGAMIDLGTLPGSDTSYTWDINNAGVVSGTCLNPDPPADGSANLVAVIWIDRQIVDLNLYLPEESGWWLASAYGINDSGQIVGTGTLDGRQRGYVLTPVDA